MLHVYECTNEESALLLPVCYCSFPTIFTRNREVVSCATLASTHFLELGWLFSIVFLVVPLLLIHTIQSPSPCDSASSNEVELHYLNSPWRRGYKSTKSNYSTFHSLISTCLLEDTSSIQFKLFILYSFYSMTEYFTNLILLLNDYILLFL